MQAAGTDPWFEPLKQGLALQKNGQRQQAQAVYKKVLQQNPNHPLALHLAGVVAGQLGHPEEAVSLLRQSLALHPADPVAWNNLANALKDLDALDAALIACDEALARAPGYASAWYTRASTLLALSRQSEAIEAFEKCLQLAPDHPFALGGLWRADMESCRWSQLQAIEQAIRNKLPLDASILAPFEALSFTQDSAVHLRCAQAFGDAIKEREAIAPMVHSPQARTPNKRIKVAYFSADLHEHATAYLTAELFENHDRTSFETFALSFGPDDQSPMRARLQKAFEHFVDVRDMSNDALAQFISQRQIDILVDLKGYTRGARTSVLLRKPAPIQVNYLGYPGSMGQQVFDYILGDPVVTPFSHASHYAERIVQLPNSYQANDSKRSISPLVPSRQEEGLPSSGFVFAAFNNCYKITPAFFDVWMRLLNTVPSSVLWLIGDKADTQNHLRAQAQARGVHPDRLVFARRLSLDQHLARHAHANVLLDTLPYNAHTTASDALWAGVPVITCIGQTFAGRVAASLLHACNLADLVTNTLEQYEALALQLATDPRRLEQVRRQLSQKRSHHPLFDSKRFVGDVEKAYRHMYQQWQKGLPPQAFAVSQLDG